jgi:SAM-dependent methyltransferase
VRGGIPRFVRQLDELAERTQASFGYEWTHFHEWHPSGQVNFDDYFDGFDLEWLRGRRVLDAGCGMGRHARFAARYARQLVALDFSRAIDQAARNLSDAPNAACIQGDVTGLPFADESFDFVYCLGVLHHLSDPRLALASVVRKVRPRGRVRLYVYRKRHGWSGALLSGINAARRVTTRLPLLLLRALCWVLSIGLTGVVIVPYRALAAAGVTAHSGWPLFVYTKYPFRVLYNDQFDRFSAPIEKRYDRDEVQELLESAGLREVRVFEKFGWIAEGVR